MIQISNAIASMFIDSDRFLVTVKSGYDELSLILMNYQRDQTALSTIKGSKCSLISRVGEKIFIGVDNKLLVTDAERCLNGECNWKEVLKASHVSNVFRCLTPTKEYLYCIEYGEPPTYLYRSKDGYNWESLSKAQDIDKKARHYHSLAYDYYRDMLIVTLGDGCRTRAAISYDGRNFKTINRGMVQFLPIQVTKQKIFFGSDDPLISGIAIYDPEIGKWHYIYYKYIYISIMYIIH